MIQCIDIFSRLLIATITFVVPILINLLSTFTSGEKRRKELSTKSQDELSKRAAEEVQTNKEKIKEIITKASDEYKLIERSTKSELDKLNPLKQFWLIFTNLFISFILLMLSYLIRSNTFDLYNHIFSVIVLIGCGLFYGISLFFIIRILYTISRTRKIIDGV